MYMLSEIFGMTDNIYKAFDSGSKVAMVFLDISRAFDRVWHRSLLFKLKKFGIGGKMLSWFESYLSSRSQKMVLSGSESTILTTNSGVHQGSHWGRSCFLFL